MTKDGTRGRSLPTGRVRRTVPLVGLTSLTAADRVASALRRRLGNDRALVEFHERAARRYAARLGNARGALMKLGQLLSFVEPAGFIGEEYWGLYRETLAGLRERAEPMDPEVALATVEAELGGPVEKLFASFDGVPLAAASIGQVHRATRHDGRVVAVKVQYPGVADAVEADLANAELLATAVRIGSKASGRGRSFDAHGVAAELGARLREELDYAHERRNQEELAELLGAMPGVRIPVVHAELSSARVLTTDLATGLSWDEALVAPAELRDAWGLAIFRFFFSPLYGQGVFHADPHPGNYVFHEDGSVTFLDFGCVKRLPQDALDSFVAIVLAAMADDAPALGEEFRRAGFVPALTADQARELLDIYRPSYAPFTGPQPYTYSSEYAAAVLLALGPAGANSDLLQDFNLPPSFVFTTRIWAGLSSVLGALRATGRWRDEFDANLRDYEAHRAERATAGPGGD